MKIIALLLILLCGFGGCASTPKPKPESSAVRLDFKDGGTCSGTAVGKHTLLSAAHCFSIESGEMDVNGKATKYAITARDGWDHVLVTVDQEQENPARIGPAPLPGDAVRIIGNPHGLRSLWRHGIVSGDWDSDPCALPQWAECRMTLMDMNTTNGDSGAGYYDADGNVVAVHTGLVTFDTGWRISVTFPMTFTKTQLAAIR